MLITPHWKLVPFVSRSSKSLFSPTYEEIIRLICLTEPMHRFWGCKGLIRWEKSNKKPRHSIGCFLFLLLNGSYFVLSNHICMDWSTCTYIHVQHILAFYFLIPFQKATLIGAKGPSQSYRHRRCWTLPWGRLMMGDGWFLQKTGGFSGSGNFPGKNKTVLYKLFKQLSTSQESA